MRELEIDPRNVSRHRAMLDLSCLMHIVGRGRRVGVPLRARHIADLLAG